MIRNPMRELPREVAVLSAVAFAVAVGFGILAPAIPVFAREFGVGRTAAGAVISAFALMRFVSALGSGQLVDRFGERAILVTGIGIVAVSSGLAGLSQSYVQLLVLRGIGGIGSAMFTVSALSLLLRVVHADRRGQASAMWQGGFLLGGMLGPAVGGALATNSVRAPFFVYAATLAVAGSIGMIYLRRPSAAELEDAAASGGTGNPADGAGNAAGGAGNPGAGTGLRSALAQPPYVAALTASLATGWALFGLRISLMPLFVTEALELSPAWTGAGFLISAVAQALALIPAARLTDRVGRRPALMLGTGLGAASYLLVAASPTLAAFLGSMVVFGAGAAFLGVAPAAIVGDVTTRSDPVARARPERIRGGRTRGGRGKAVGVYQMASDLGAVLGPLVAGWLADRYSFGAAFVLTAGLLTLALVMAIRMPETRVPRSAAVPAAG